MERNHEVEAVLGRVFKLAGEREDIRAVALVGSYAYGRPRSDSDVDVVVLTTAVERFSREDDWLPRLAATE